MEDRDRFWKITFEEIGRYDIPATIDYILHTTNHTKLHYIGHSQGCATFFVMLSELPEYNKKIKMMHALAPAVYMNHAASPVFRVAELFPTVVQVRSIKISVLF